MRGKRRERRRGGSISGERRREPGRGRRGQVVVEWCGAREGLKGGGVRRELGRLLFPLRCANDIRGCSTFGHPGVRDPLALGVMPQALDEAASLRRGDGVHVAAQLGHALLEPRALHGEESDGLGGPGGVEAQRGSTSLHVTVAGVCSRAKTHRGEG